MNLDNLNFDRVIGLIGLILTVASFAYAFYLFKKGQRGKLISIFQTPAIPVAFGPGEIPNVSLRYASPQGNIEVKHIFRVFILIWNTGFEAIESIDFVKPITMKSIDQSLLFAGVFAK